MDGVINTDVGDGSPLSTKTYVSKTAEDIMRHMGFRYLISFPLMNILSENQDKKYLFTGKL